jgi:hypothetical protein
MRFVEAYAISTLVLIGLGCLDNGEPSSTLGDAPTSGSTPTTAGNENESGDASGHETEDAVDPDPMGAFRLVCSRWDGTAQNVYAVDPDTGAQTHLGVLGDLSLWASQLVLDPWSERAFALGYASDADHDAGRVTLYTLGLQTGGFEQVRVGDLTLLAGVTSDGLVVAARSDVSESERTLAVALVDSDSAESVHVGTLTTSHLWQGNASGAPHLYYDRTRANAYAVSTRDGGAERLHALDLEHGTATSLPLSGPSGDVMLAGGGPDGHLAGVLYAHDGDAFAGGFAATIDPESGEITAVGAMPGLWSSDWRPASDPFRAALYIYGSNSTDDLGLYGFDFAASEATVTASASCILARY